MKNLFPLFILFIIIYSCENKEKYQGRWTNSMLKYSGYNEARNLVIENDSIKICYPYFEYWHKYPLSIKNNNLNFNGLTLKSIIDRDTLTLNDSIYFIRDKADTLYGAKILLSIDLPKTSHLLNPSKQDNNATIYINYGKRLDNGEFSLQLNGSYADFNDIPSFLAIGHRSGHLPLPVSLLFIDKSAKLNDIEKLFFEHQKINFLQIELVIDINLNYSDSLGFHYEYITLNKKLPPFQINKDYVDLVFDYSTPPPPPFSPWFENDNSKLNYILLIENQFYYKNQIIEKEELFSIVKSFIEENQIILSLYDLNSNYGSFIEMNATINSVYMKVREEKSQLKYGKSYVKLTKSESDSIKNATPMKHIWSYSIPHYNSVIKKDKTFFGLKVKLIDSLLAD
ncbi:hypothetical protein [Aquaticitalea lipolytica]|uniref:hypothetical protein n=1 Tax=Aquaticitalea lipolytica TaxID=1247562 RepID=UPI0024BA1123|nr:hypothetical protein [Aquaticitalea lipolytica]